MTQQPIRIELHYLPCLAYFAAIRRSGKIVVEKHENFVKQSYRNRCHINTTQGTAKLIVPLREKHGHTPISEVRVDYAQKWLNNHWRTIQSAYGNAPFFEYYADDLHKILFSKPEHLYDLNFRLLTMCLKWLKWTAAIQESDSYEDLSSELDLRSVIHPKKDDNLYAFYYTKPYTQVFGNKFVSNLSIIDLVFCLGPDASDYLQVTGKE